MLLSQHFFLKLSIRKHHFFAEIFDRILAVSAWIMYPEIGVAKNGKKRELDPSKILKKRVFWTKILQGIWLSFERYLLETTKKPL